MYNVNPAPEPKPAPRPAGLSMVALVLGALALLLALPILWWRLNSPATASVSAQLLDVITQASTVNNPGWVTGVRAGAMLMSFLSLVCACIALILKHSGRLAAIAFVLALAALAATSWGLALAVVAGVILIGVLLLGMGIG